MSRIIYIINPISGTRAKKKTCNSLLKLNKGRKKSLWYFSLCCQWGLFFSSEFIRNNKVTDGDCRRRWHGEPGGEQPDVFDLNFGIIPCGSKRAGMQPKFKVTASCAQSWFFFFFFLPGKPVPTDGFYLNEQFACMLCGLGFDAKVAHDFARQPKRGLATYVKQVVRNFSVLNLIALISGSKEKYFNWSILYQYCQQQPVWQQLYHCPAGQFEWRASWYYYRNKTK